MAFSYFLKSRTEKSRVVFNVTISSFAIKDANINEVLRPVPEQPTNIIWPPPESTFSIEEM
jgi:hypothetical protein